MKNVQLDRAAAARIARQIAETTGVVTQIGDHRAAPGAPQPHRN
jgi:hypothetical protein